MSEALTRPVAPGHQWDGRADVIVVGGGIAGVCAAIEARAGGADVLLIEAASGTGGSSALAAGHFYLGGGTPVQHATGFEDSPEEMFKFLAATSIEPNEAIIRTYCEGSVEHFHWLEAQGIPFERSYYKDKHVIQPGKDCLIWTGNEKVWPFREQAVPAPRGHKVAVDGQEGGALAMRLLAGNAEDAGVRVQCDTTVMALLVDRAGRIVGVRTRSFGVTSDVAAGSVVLTTGGFNMNDEMVARHVPDLAGVDRHGTPYDDGSGIMLGEAAGGYTVHMDGALITSPFYPPSQLLKGIVVNSEGRRFVAEDSYHGRVGSMILKQPGRKAYLILDAAIFGYPEYEFHPLIDAWQHLAEMETDFHLPVGSLVDTMENYNRHAVEGRDPEFGKHPDWIAPLITPPYGAFDLSFGEATYMSGLTFGGLCISPDGEVLRRKGGTVEGLYAAGSCASAISQSGLGYASGTNLGQASFFGRRAGRHAARLATTLANRSLRPRSG